MEADQLILFALSLGGYYALHSVLAENGVKRFLYKKLISKRFYRIIYNLMAVFLLLPLGWYYQTMASFRLFDIEWLSYIGIGIVVLGSILMLVALRQYDLSEFAGTQQLKATNPKAFAPLKTDGFNGLVRHPLYFAGLLMLWGWFLFKPTDLFLVVALVSSVYLYFGTLLEERKLVLEFGEPYVAYQRKVWMLLPLGRRK